MNLKEIGGGGGSAALTEELMRPPSNNGLPSNLALRAAHERGSVLLAE